MLRWHEPCQTPEPLHGAMMQWSPVNLNTRYECWNLTRSRARGSQFYKTPWRGAPYVNLQPTANGQAKPYQVRQVLQAIDRLEQEQQ